MSSGLRKKRIQNKKNAEHDASGVPAAGQAADLGENENDKKDEKRG